LDLTSQKFNTVVQEQQMSFLSAFGNDVKKVFGWLGSPKGQAIIRTGEAVVEAIDPALDGVITLTNTWVQEIYKAQALANAAGATGTTGSTQKSALVLNAVTPQVLAFLKTQGLAPANSTQLQAANDALVAFLNALGGTATTAATTTSTTGTSVASTTTGAIPTAYATQLP
jgi:hypothetical protein